MELIKKNLVIIIFIIICATVTLLAFIINKKTGFDGYFIYSNIASYRCNNDECYEVDNEDLNKKELDYNVYLDNKEYKDSHLEYVKVWNIFDKNMEYISSPIDFFAYSGDFKIDYYDKKNTSELTDDDINYIKENLKNIKEYKPEYSVVYNIDLDENDIRLVIVSNYNEDTVESKDALYAFAYIDINNNRSEIYKKVFRDPLLTKNVYLNSAYKIDNNIYLAIKEEKNHDLNEHSIELYKIEKDKLIKMN